MLLQARVRAALVSALVLVGLGLGALAQDATAPDLVITEVGGFGPELEYAQPGLMVAR